MKTRQWIVVDRDEGVKESVDSLSDDLLLTHGDAEKVLRALKAYYTDALIADKCASAYGTADGFVEEVTITVTPDGVTISEQ